ncbi:DDB1- and CUL4-associated factor 13 [Trichinella papuae]|uniref:DDB1- and CUL4-associated factor 13 n=1 Tax=Trichinella papuae TaxID=268474 RepID=A0A0V1N415_9BILA|nr:DDB1- and CUL4-associated factor 13 [Trichinella papuae]
MRVKVISRNPDEYMRETKSDIFKVPRNYDSSLHPFQAQREYARALNAVKLERVFAKPFLGSLDGHFDGVHCLAKHPTSLTTLLSGAYDGEIRLWNLASRKCISNIKAHTGFVRGMCAEPSGETFFSVGDDKSIKRWPFVIDDSKSALEPISTFLSSDCILDVTHHWKENKIATCGNGVQVWEHTRASPIRIFEWGVDSVYKVDLFAALSSDRSIMLYDCRAHDPLHKVVMKLKSNAISWNPMEAFVFTVANEDYNLYSFDLRKMSSPFMVHMDHISAVMDVDYSPTGREFVSGSYDKTIRIFNQSDGKSREIYHTKRMQRVMCVAWSLDNKYIVSGSDEMNLRVWKAKAWEKLGPMAIRERNSQKYAEKLKERYKYFPEIKRIAQHRHVPKHVYNARAELDAMRKSQKRKEKNRRAHSKPGTVPFVAEKKKHIVGEED